jgi:hypothetical protein
MRFDAYHGNVWEGRFDHVAELIAHHLHGRVQRGRPRGRYGCVLDVFDGAESVGWVADDTVNQTSYFEFKGQRSPDVAKALREGLAPGAHNVSRADVCEDYCEPGAHLRLVQLVDRAKQDPRVLSEAITPRDGDRGETVYWGSRKSSLLVRVYEKGKQKENLHLRRFDWARLELQCRPSKAEHKRLAATLDPLSLWGFGKWTKNVAEAATGLELERFAPPQEAPQFDRTTVYIATAFRRHFEEMKSEGMDWECIGREFEAIWKHSDTIKRGLGQRPRE